MTDWDVAYWMEKYDQIADDYTKLNCHYTMAMSKIAELELKNQWISVKDRLPDDHEDVLIWFEYFRYGDYNCLFQRYGIGNYLDKTWFVNGETGWKQLRVIAWQKLPKPPKESDTE